MPPDTDPAVADRRAGEAPAGGWLGFLDGRLRAAVLEAVGQDAAPDDALRGLYISDEQAVALAAQVAPPGAEERLDAAARVLGLDALEAAVLAVVAAPDLDPRFGRLFAYLHDDLTRRLATPRLAGRLLAGEGVAEADVVACFAPHRTLARVGALRRPAEDATQPLADRPVRPADRLAAFLLGASGAGESHAAPLRRVQPAPDGAGRPEAVARIAQLLAGDGDVPLIVCGADGAAVLADAAQGPLILLDVRDLLEPDARDDARVAAALEGALVVLDGLDGLDPPTRMRVDRALDHLGGRCVVLAASRSEALALAERTALVVEVAEPSFAERRRAWARAAGTEDVDDVAAKFRLSIAQIAAGARISRVEAQARGEATPTVGDLDLGARHASSTRLGELATRLPVRMGWDELVLPERQRDLLRSISAYLRHRDRVLTDWGYDRTVARTQGLKILFAGESGTGKTMAAEVVAHDLGLELFRVDLATVVSKYIGETEKNLERIFTAAHGSNAILFFDEADALFGKRSEVSDSHDRYANIEVAFLLQRMEAYPGAVVLATNFKRNIDDAFIRRLDFVVDFPFPEAEDRRRIWELLLPEQAPLADDLDLDFLARQFKLSGGAIRNCSLAAAFQAADDGDMIHMRHLVRAVAQEYGKQGRLTLEADFEHFHHLVR